MPPYESRNILHIGQATYYQFWWLFPTVCLCGMGKVLVYDLTWSSTRITTTIISPTPLITVNFYMLTQIVQQLGSCYSWISPKWCKLHCFHLGLVVQPHPTQTALYSSSGANVMLGRIVFQFATIVAYTVLSTDFLRWYRHNLPVHDRESSACGMMDRCLKIFACSLVFSTTTALIAGDPGIDHDLRSMYRTIELSMGWMGRIIQTEVYFNVLDGGMVVLAIYTLNLFHPALFLGHARTTDLDTGLELKLAGDIIPLKLPRFQHVCLSF
ncbi:hypothetical protein B0H10DRAFT_2162123 [Mycena sp. CBHHK59/15]|nr:hypothetical protein B0H10DRAFT_2162123 [Mycena sp. CBHHK59/15]